MSGKGNGSFEREKTAGERRSANLANFRSRKINPQSGVVS